MRILVIDEAGVRRRLTEAISLSMEVGVLVGRRASSSDNNDRDYLLLAVPLPKEQHEGATRVGNVSRDGVHAHVQQVGRMLPGGLSVLGLYAVSSDPGKHAVELLQRMWPSSSSPSSSSSFAASSFAFVHVSTQSSQWTCRAGPPMGELMAVDTKYLEGLAGQLFTYQAWLKVNISFHVHAAREKVKDEDVNTILKAEDNFFRAFLKAVQVEEKKINDALGVPVSDVEAPSSSSSSSSSLRRLEAAQRIDFYTEIFEKEETSRMNTRKQRGDHRLVHVIGTVACVACTHEKEDLQAGIQSLKQDFVQSLRGRIQVLRQETAAEVEEASQGATSAECLSHAIHDGLGGSLRLPRRVLLPLAASLPVTDYLLPGEAEEDAVGRLRDMFGCDDVVGTSSSLLVLEQEATADILPSNLEKERSKASSAAGPSTGTAQTIDSALPRKKTEASFLLMVGLGFVLLVVAAVLWQQQQRQQRHS